MWKPSLSATAIPGNYDSVWLGHESDLGSHTAQVAHIFWGLVANTDAKVFH